MARQTVISVMLFVSVLLATATAAATAAHPAHKTADSLAVSTHGHPFALHRKMMAVSAADDNRRKQGGGEKRGSGQRSQQNQNSCCGYNRPGRGNRELDDTLVPVYNTLG